MKRIIRYVVAASVFAALIAGCKSFTKGYDQNPVASSTAPAVTIFPGAQASFDLFMEGFSSQLSALWAQEATGTSSQYAGYYNYTASSQDFQNDWAIAYNNSLYNIRLTEQDAQAAGQINLEGAAKIIEGIQMGTIADLWGDVPYSQALQSTVYPHPKYQPQDSVYIEVQAALDSGIAELTANNAPLPADIFSSGGNTGIWLAAAHTAKARFLMHVARAGGYAANPTVLAQVIAQCQQGILATDGSQDWMFTHAQGVWNGDMNLWSSFIDIDRAGYMDASATFVIPMMQAASLDGKTNYSGRLAYYFIDSTGAFNDGTGGAYSGTSPFPIFRASETHLLWAEAAARTGDDGTALAQLNLAREYNNNVFGDGSADYVAGDPAVSATNILQTIINEEYVSLMSQIEVFNLVRRVDYGIQYADSTGAVHTLAPIHGSQFPQRFMYPINEVNTNPNTPTQTSADLFTKTWANQP
ncbi:MAG: SusD/RagB family nutrient-binding outer membrane lipoprotein [Candidatus Kryptoniota bacterium]